jgi:inorganic pyrophosphatase
MDDPAFVGCLVPGKLIGVIEAEQTENQKTTRNDRLIAVAADSRNHSHIRFLGDLNKNLVHEIEQFFVSYNKTKGKKFELLGRFGPERAQGLIASAATNFIKSRRTTDRSKKTKR